MQALLGQCAYDGAAAYFPNINNDMEVGVNGLLSSTLTELHAITLALECVSVSRHPWMLVPLIKILLVLIFVINNKVKNHSEVYGNKHTNLLANIATSFDIMLSVETFCHFLSVKEKPVSGNICYFVRRLFNVMSFVSWEAKYVAYAVKSMLCNEIDIQYMFSVWHPNAIHNCLSVAKKKRLYDLGYLSVLCI
ncbi:hypothetical protein G9A89_013969 [Geosiphon pyriformis]|nr:hypothetical protein G9A89_013969 [Geosiphon pyriformis]